MRKRLLIAATTAVFSITTLSLLSLNYRTPPVYVCETLLRAAALEVVAAAVEVHDPSDARKAALGPTPPLAFQSGAEFLAQLRAAYRGYSSSVIAYDNGAIVRSRYHFGYQTAEDARIRKLRDKYGVAPLFAKGDFAGSLALMNWVHSQWPHGGQDYGTDAFDADSVLARAKRGERFWCTVYAKTFIQLASSVGVQARLVGLSRDGYADHHAVAEVWSNEKRKWFVVDPDFNVWYSRDGVPLDALQIHAAVRKQETHLVSINKGPRRPPGEMERRIPSLYDLYRFFSVHLRNDWLTNRYFPGHPARSDRSTLFWRDSDQPPVLNLEIQDPDSRNYYWDLNRTQLRFQAAPSTPGSLEVRLSTTTPDFSHFSITLDNVSVTTTADGVYQWRLHPGRNELTVKSVNALGRQGVPARVAAGIAGEPDRDASIANPFP